MLQKQLLKSFVLFTITTFCGILTATAEDTINLKFAYWAPPVSAPAVQGIIPWGEAIEKATNGRVKVTFFGGEAMAKAPDHYDLAMTGTADITWIDPNFTPGVFPLSEVFSLPFMFPDAEVASAAMWEIMDTYLAGTDYKHVKVLWAWSVGVVDLFSKKPVIKLEDFRGMKLAAMSPVQSSIYKALGAKGVYMIEPDVYTSLERGMIDGRFHNWEGAWIFKNFEVTNYRTVNVNISTMPNIIIMNKKKWDSLPADIQKIIMAESGLKYSVHMGKVFKDENAHFLKEIGEWDKKHGNPPITYLDPEEKKRWIAATQPVVEDWIKKRRKKALFAGKMVDDLRKFVANY